MIPRIGLGGSLYHNDQKDLNTFAQSINQAVGTTGGTLTSLAVAPQLLLGFQTTTWNIPVLLDVYLGRSSQNTSTIIAQTQVTHTTLEITPKASIWGIDDILRIWIGPSITWIGADGNFSIKTPAQNTAFTGSSALYGIQGAFEIRPWASVSLWLWSGYRLGQIQKLRILESNGTIFSKLTVGETLQLTEIGKDPRNLVLNYSGWFITTSVVLTL